MAKLNYIKNRSYVVECTFRKHLKPKIGDIVLALDYKRDCDSMMIGRLIGIESPGNPLGSFKVEPLEWEGSDTFMWQQAYKIPDGVMTVETND